jgi:hypothetical protein
MFFFMFLLYFVGTTPAILLFLMYLYSVISLPASLSLPTNSYRTFLPFLLAFTFRCPLSSPPSLPPSHVPCLMSHLCPPLLAPRSL